MFLNKLEEQIKRSEENATNRTSYQKDTRSDACSRILSMLNAFKSKKWLDKQHLTWQSNIRCMKSTLAVLLATLAARRGTDMGADTFCPLLY